MNIANRTSNTKTLIPYLEGNHVHRERLTDILHNNIHTQLQVISAPAGYGKTTLLADFIQNIDAPVCWYTLSAEDEDPKLFLEGIITSIASCFPNFGQLIASRLKTTGDIRKDTIHLLSILANEISISIQDYFIFVLEDYHVIQDSEPTKAVMNLLLEKIPENCHFIISSRTQVELPVISRLMLKNHAAILTMSHLSFTAAETKLLAVNCFSRDLLNEDADRLVKETGGWAISLMLHLNSVRVNGLFQLPNITQDQVFKYMNLEIFEKQIQETQHFLLVSSTIDDMKSEFMEHLIPGVNYYKVMSSFVKQNLFLQCVDEARKIYRYHQLFREFLQEKLRKDDPALFMLLHSKAALLYEREYQWIEAITHYHIARKYRKIVRIIKDKGPDLLKAGKCAIMQRWFCLLPANLKDADPELILMNAQCLGQLGNTEESMKLLARLLGKVVSDQDWLLKAEALSWRGAISRAAGYFREAKSDVAAAIRLLEEHHGPTTLLGVCHRRLGDIYKDQGQFFSALKHLRLAQKCYASVFDTGALAVVHNSLGVIYKRLGQLTRAKMFFEKARAGWEKIDNIGELAATLNNIGIIHQRFGQYDLALDVFYSGLEKAKEVEYLRIEAVIKISIADVLREIGRFDEALKAYHEGVELARQSMESTYIAYATAGIGETYRLLRQYDKARTLLEEARHQSQDQKQPYEAALFDIQLGIIDYETGQFELAKIGLTDAAKRLQTIGDKDALAKIHFHLAQAAFLSRDYKVAAGWLEKTSNLADELGYENFLVVEARKTLPLVHYGIKMGIGNGRFVRVLEKIRTINTVGEFSNTAELSKGSNSKTEQDIEVHALGYTEVMVNNHHIKDIEWRSNRAKELFFYLLTHFGGRTREEITSALWPDLSPAKGSSNFHINLFRARRALFPGVFLLEDGKYRINPDLRIWFDVIEFEQLARIHPQAREGYVAFERAVELYVGPFLAEFYTEWVQVLRHELENTYLRVLSQLADLQAENRNFEKAVTLLEKSIAIDPYQEDTYCQIMRLYLERKNKPLARRVYQQYLNALAGEKELEASPQIKNLIDSL